MKQWLKATSVEWGRVEIAAREDFKSTAMTCEQIVHAARCTGVDQAIEVGEGLDAINNAQGAHQELFEELLALLASYRYEYAFRLLQEWPGAAAFSILQTKILAANSETGVEEDRREEVVKVCAVVWTEQGLSEAAKWWLANCYNEDHVPEGAEGAVQGLAKLVSSAPEQVSEETKAKAFAGALSGWISRQYAKVSSAALPLLLTMEPHYFWNGWFFTANKKAWLEGTTAGFAWALIGDEPIYETLSLPDGSEYKGEHVNGKPHGRGTTVTSQGSRFAGTFRYGKRHGPGSFTFTTDGEEVKCIGQWWRGVSYGSLVMVRSDGIERPRPPRKATEVGRDVVASLVDDVPDSTLRRMIVGLVLALVLVPVVYVNYGKVKEYEENKQDWIGWVATCGFDRDDSDRIASYLAETEGSSESMVLDFEDYYADFMSIVRSAPDDRPGYLAQRLSIAIESDDIDVPANVTTRCAQNIDSAMTEHVRLVDEMWKQQLQELGVNPEDADIFGLKSAIENDSVD